MPTIEATEAGTMPVHGYVSRGLIADFVSFYTDTVSSRSWPGRCTAQADGRFRGTKTNPLALC